MLRNTRGRVPAAEKVTEQCSAAIPQQTAGWKFADDLHATGDPTICSKGVRPTGVCPATPLVDMLIAVGNEIWGGFAVLVSYYLVVTMYKI